MVKKFQKLFSGIFFLMFMCVLLLSSNAEARGSSIETRVSLDLGVNLTFFDVKNYGKDEYDMIGVDFGFDVSVGNQLSSTLTAGGMLSWQFMVNPPYVNVNGTEVSDWNAVYYDILIAPFLQYNFSKNSFFAFAFGFAVFSTAGEDDFMGSVPMGVGADLRVGHDFEGSNFGIFAGIGAYYTMASWGITTADVQNVIIKVGVTYIFGKN